MDSNRVEVVASGFSPPFSFPTLPVGEDGLVPISWYLRTVFRTLLIAAIVAIVAIAPMQCQGSEDPSTSRSESPGDALYALAQEFREKGEQDAYQRTLRFIIDRYPSSRRAVTARSELDALK